MITEKIRTCYSEVMNTLRSSLFGTVSLICAALSIVACTVFFLSGYVLPGNFDEQTIVITQLCSLMLIPILAIVGLIVGIVGIGSDSDKAMAKAGIVLNAVLLALMAMAAAFLMIASSEVQPEEGLRVPDVRIEKE